MTLRKTEIIEWSTTPAELRRIADELEEKYNINYERIGQKKYKDLKPLIYFIYGGRMELHIAVDIVQMIDDEQWKDKD